MNNTQLNPYLNFEGNCKEAMEFYQSVLGGELKIDTYGDFHADVPDEAKAKVMHSVLKNDTLTFMGSDGAPDSKITVGDNVGLSLSGTDEEYLKKAFTGLSVDGTITMPLEKQVWGDQFGMLTDKFGIHWLVNVTSPENVGK